MTNLLKRGDTYEEIYRNFKWNIPLDYNIADDVCDRAAEGSVLAGRVWPRARGRADPFRHGRMPRSREGAA